MVHLNSHGIKKKKEEEEEKKKKKRKKKKKQKEITSCNCMIRLDTAASKQCNDGKSHRASRTDMFEFADRRVEGLRLAASCVCLGEGEG
jgi:hypothetical protein